mgnify:CR=1 FL=1
MGESRVTEYMIKYLKDTGISSRKIAEQTKIPEDKLKPGYKEPLLADEFLRLCVLLKLSPEKISGEIHAKDVIK